MFFKSGFVRAMLARAWLSVGIVAPAGAVTVYTSDPNLADFTAGINTYATLSNFTGGDVSSPYTPTTATLNTGLRVFTGGAISGLPAGNNWILATFSRPFASIV